MRALCYTVLARLRDFLRRRDAEAEFDQELDAHLAMAEQAKIRSGIAVEEARRLARAELGGVAQVREAARDARGLPWLSGVWLDLTLGARLLARHPGLALVSTVALAIGIATVAAFHTATDFFVRPSLPVPDQDRLVAIWNHDTAASDKGRQTVGDMLAWRAQLRSVEDLGAFALFERVMSSAAGPTQLLRTAQISPAALRAVRVPPLLGRPLLEADQRAGSPAVALIGYDLWRSAFGGDAAVLGRTIGLGGVEHTVVGVMPETFAFPVREQIWTPLSIADPGLRPGEGPEIEFSVARLAPGATLDAVRAELDVVGARLAAESPRTHARLRPRVATYARSFFDSGEPELPALIAAARVAIVIVLLVVAVNVGTLVYARNASRIGEVTIRSALGASRRRIVLQMFAEALVLATLAAVVAGAIMAWPLIMLGDLFGEEARAGGVPYWFTVELGADSLLLLAALIVVSALLTGVLPALKLTSRRGTQGLARMHDQSAGLRFGRTATAVVLVQVTLSLALLIVGGAQLRTYGESWRALQDDPMPRDEYLAADVRWDLTPSGRHAGSPTIDELERRFDILRGLSRRLSQEPDVRGVTFTSFDGVRPIVLDGGAPSAAWALPWTYVSLVEPNFLDVLGIPLRAGRPLRTTDPGGSAARVALVNEEFLRRARLPGDPVGQRVRTIDVRSGGSPGPALEIVGIVGDLLSLDITHQGPAWTAQPTVYVPLAATPSAVGLLVHTADDPVRLAGRLPGIASELDPTLVLHRPMSVEERGRAGFELARLYGYAVGFVVFAIVLLSTAGTYSMMSFTVAQRTREIGIRTALGASPRRVVREVFSRAIWQLGLGTVLGVAIGLPASGVFATTPALQGPGLPLGVAAVVLLLGLVACGRPVRRALRIQPTEALRDGT